MDVLEAIRSRRSIRRFKTQGIDPATLEKLLEAIRWAPSWANLQCWRFVLVRDPDLRLKVAECLRAAREGRRNYAYTAVCTAPITVVACAQRGLSGFYRPADGIRSPATDKGEYWYMYDVGLAMQNLTLAAHGLGLGTVHLGLFDAGEVAKVLSLPPEAVVVAMTPLGYPDENPAGPPRKELREIIYENVYGQPVRLEDDAVS
ncbi:MAG: nitroreductase family protein [Chloroflexi bacterium]|nr:nitroreductase family protein [Chloroflexota bacterium]